MSQIKTSILILITLLNLTLHPQNFEGDNLLEKNRIDVFMHNASQEKERGQYYEAINTYEEALELTIQINDKKDQGKILAQLANIYVTLEDTKNAERNILKAIGIQTAIEDEINLAFSRFVYGTINLYNNDYFGALDYFKSASAKFEEENLEELVAEVSLYQGKAYKGLKQLNQANVALDKAIVLSKKLELPLIESSALIESAYIALSQEKPDKAISQATKGSEIAQTNNNLKLLNESYLVLSDIYEKEGSYDLANHNLKLYIHLNDSILALKKEILADDKKDQYVIDDQNALLQTEAEDLEEKKDASSLGKLTTILSVALITILSLLTLSLYKNNNIRLKTNNMLYKKNEELLTEKERAEIAAKTKSNFLSTVTHELRTPLYAVTGLTNMLLEENPKQEQIQHLKSLKFSGDYLLTFINDILQINKIEANKVELDPEIFNLKHKVENVISALNNSAIDNNIAIHFEYDKNLPEVFNGDQLKISQILINLIGNAIKFTKDGDIWVRVKLINQRKKKYNIRLEVEDNGIGISQEKQNNMFESFSQGSVQINRKYGGTGLGLSIVKGLIEILKGKIFLESELGKGTKFTVEVPLDKTNESVKDKSQEFAHKLNKLDLNNVNILIVEDNKINQMITKKILTKMNLKCDIVDNGEDAVDRVQEVTYDVVLMDIHMPGISGLEATKRIRGFDKELTIFALTAVTLEDKMHEFEEAGFDDIISKPFKQEDFEKKLFAALSKEKVSA